MVRLLCLVLLLVSPLCGVAKYPGKTWKHHRPPGWSMEKLAAARAYSATIKTAAVMIVQDGAVVDEWGETARKFNCHSMRKSLLSAMCGIHVRLGHINLEKTMADLGIDDNDPLTADEKRATVRDLIKARSGIYHAALYETPGMTASKPPRHSHAPGAFWHYNNWDFNAVGTIFEQETKTKIFEEFKKRFADPLEMQDFQVSDGEYVRGAQSLHAAYPFRMTARDLARFGYLFLNNGKWKKRQIVPADWVAGSTRSYSDAGRGLGYGYMWWTQPEGYSARGAGGHYVVVMPARGLVVVHRVNTDIRGNQVGGAEFDKLLELILEAAPEKITPASKR